LELLILRKIIKVIATRCQILRLKCTKFHPKPHWGSLQHFPNLSSWNKGDLFLMEGSGREEEGKAGEGKGEKRIGGNPRVYL